MACYEGIVAAHRDMSAPRSPLRWPNQVLHPRDDDDDGAAAGLLVL